MKLENKKSFASRVLKVGKGRIVFNKNRLNEIKEAITKQDIRDLVASQAISIRQITGRRKIERKKTRRRMGSRRKSLIGTKQEYVMLTRKLRRFISNLKTKGKISNENYRMLRKEIRSRNFKNLGYMKERISQIGEK